jgi:hypothetical protein
MRNRQSDGSVGSDNPRGSRAGVGVRLRRLPEGDEHVDQRNNGQAHVTHFETYLRQQIIRLELAGLPDTKDGGEQQHGLDPG